MSFFEVNQPQLFSPTREARNKKELTAQETIYYSFSETEKLKFNENEVKFERCPDYPGVFSQPDENAQQQNLQESSRQKYQEHYEPFYKFPIIQPAGTEKDKWIFTKCASNVKESLKALHDISPFKRGTLLQKQPGEGDVSFHSENIIDTIDDERTVIKLSPKKSDVQVLSDGALDDVEVKDIDSQLITMEDNNNQSHRRVSKAVQQ